MIKISPPLAVTLMYRGLPRGIVRMQPVNFPPVPGSSVLQELRGLSGWLEPSEDYAAVRDELSGEGRELQALEAADPEVIQERIRHWKELYRSNDLGFLEIVGTGCRAGVSPSSTLRPRRSRGGDRRPWSRPCSA